MVRLIDDTFSRGLETVRTLMVHPKFTAELAAAIRKDGGADKAVVALLKAFDLTFEQTVEDQIAALRLANSEEGWGIPDEVINNLAATAPAWPKGKDSYRSFRIRFGEGDKGVARTFEAHATRINRVYGNEKFWRWNLLRSDKKRLRLLSGNASHKPVVEWIIVHLDANRKRKSIEAVRGPKSLADEGLVLAWLFPKRVQAIDYDKWCAWFCGGYELSVPEDDDESWQGVPYVNFDRGDRQARLYAYWRSSGSSGFSVPFSEE